MVMINDSEATSLELIVRRVYNCGKGGVMGIADASHLERNPLDAAIVIFAPLYKEQREIEEIDAFMNQYSSIFNFPERYTYNEETVANYIEGLRNLVGRYF